jgi:hypothetical protein
MTWSRYLIHASLPLALGVYALTCLGCVACLRALPIETVGRPMPSSMAELVHSLQVRGLSSPGLSSPAGGAPHAQLHG